MSGLEPESFGFGTRIEKVFQDDQKGQLGLRWDGPDGLLLALRTAPREQGALAFRAARLGASTLGLVWGELGSADDANLRDRTPRVAQAMLG